MSRKPIIFSSPFSRVPPLPGCLFNDTIEYMPSTSEKILVKRWYAHCGAAYYGLFLQISGSVTLSEQMLVELFVTDHFTPSDPDLPIGNCFKYLLPKAADIVVRHLGHEKVRNWFMIIKQ